MPGRKRTEYFRATVERSGHGLPDHLGATEMLVAATVRGLPHTGEWREIVNTDAEAYSGSGVGNMGAVHADEQPWHGQPASATLRLPPLGVLYLAAPT